ncbi:MAG TPA: hypothetical protein VM848_06015 [Acidimicrobiia bacterium]|nr:hypothetical protein [Acidimicrobiia bacterium]
MTADPSRSPESAVRNLVDELNQTLRQTVTEYRLVSAMYGRWAHISFTDDQPVRLDDSHWLHVILDLYYGDRDDERGQFRSHVLKAIFTYLDSPDVETGEVLAYHLHPLDLAGAGWTLVPHLHTPRSNELGHHIYVGRCCIEDLLEYLIREEQVPIVEQQHPLGKSLTQDELVRRATTRLHDGRELFHQKFKTWHGMTPISDLPDEAQDILRQLR